MKAIKKVLSLLLALAVVFSTLGAMPFSVLAAKSDEDLIMNFDLGAGSGSNTDYSCKDYFSDSYAKTYSWSSNANVTSVGGENAL